MNALSSNPLQKISKACVIGLFFLISSQSFAAVSATESGAAATAENWKGTTQVSPIEFGLLTGDSIYGSSSNWSVLASAAYLIKPDGWIDGVDDRVWVEVQMGPTFFSVTNSAHTGMQYNAQLRWDFAYNESWTFYGAGGFGGWSLPSVLGSWAIHPRVAVGTEYQTKTALLLRAEIAADFMGAGIAFNF